MKKIIHFYHTLSLAKAGFSIALILLPVLSFAQFDYSTTITYKHNRHIGQDASVWQLTNGASACIPTGQTVPPSSSNYGNDIVGSFMAWTWNAVGCPNGRTRFYLRFPQLSLLARNTISAGAVTITSAILTLHGVGTVDLTGSYGNSSYPGSPLLTTNEGSIRKIAAGANNISSPNNWREDNITWNSSQNITVDASIPAVPIPVTGSRYGWTQSFDVTAMVARMIRDASGYFNGSTWIAPDLYANNGFVLQLNNETEYRSQFYATSDNADPSLWPELTVTYSVDAYCATFTDLSFNYTTDNTNPLLFTFSANNPSFPVGYRWYVAAGSAPFTTPVGTNPTLTYTFPNTGIYRVAMATFCTQDIISNVATIIVSNNGIFQTPQKAVHQSGSTLVEAGDEPKQGDDAMNRIPPGDGPSALVSTEPEISVTPNPTEGNWTVKLNVREAAPAHLTLFDLSGKKIRDEIKLFHNGTNTFDIATQDLSSGLYIMNLRGASMNIQKKLTKR